MIRLPTVLRVNSVFSIVSGSAMAVGSVLLEDLVGVAALWLVGIGIGVVLFGVAVGRIARNDPVPRRAGWAVVLADLGWVVGAAILIFGFPDVLTGAGKWTLGIISVFVLDLATLQVVGLNRSTGDG